MRRNNDRIARATGIAVLGFVLAGLPGCGGSQNTGSAASEQTSLPPVATISPDLSAIPSVPGLGTAYTISSTSAPQPLPTTAASLALGLPVLPAGNSIGTNTGGTSWHPAFRNLTLIHGTSQAATLLQLPTCTLVEGDGNPVEYDAIDWFAGTILIAANPRAGNIVRIDCGNAGTYYFDEGSTAVEQSTPTAWAKIVNGDILIWLALPVDFLSNFFVMNLLPAPAANTNLVIATLQTDPAYGKPFFNVGPKPAWVQPGGLVDYLERFVVPARFEDGQLLKCKVRLRDPMEDTPAENTGASDSAD